MNPLDRIVSEEAASPMQEMTYQCPPHKSVGYKHAGTPISISESPSLQACVAAMDKAESVYGDAQSDAAEAYEPNIVAEDLVRINDSGIVPTEFKVLVLPDLSEVELRARRMSNFALPPGVAESHAHGTVTGTIIAMSPAAFSYHDWPSGCRIPIVGERIVYARYAGMIVDGKSGIDAKGNEEKRQFRLLNDKDIAAVLEF